MAMQSPCGTTQLMSYEARNEFKAHRYPNYWKVLATQADKQERKMRRVVFATRKASKGKVATASGFARGSQLRTAAYKPI